MPEPLVPGQEEEVYVRPHQFQQQAKPKPTWKWARAASLAAVAGVVSVYLIWRNGGIEAARLPSNPLPASSRVVTPDEQLQPAAITAQPEQQPSPVATPAVNQPPQQTATEPPPPGTEQLLPPAPVAVRSETPAPTSTVSQAATPQADSEGATIHIELSAIEPTWLSISADGKTTYSGTLAAMQTKSFNGKDSAQIRTANAGGVNVIFNGRALGPLGRRGQARTIVFTKSGYEVVRGLGGGNATMAHLTGG